jgi:DNA repair protein RecN (Recombination protein N)
MLTDLVVEGLGVIDRAELSLQPGCTALTGETGAGKTLVVAALSLVLGGRADRNLVRTGAGEARVEARFVLSPAHPAADLLSARGVLDLHSSDGEVEVVVVRTVAADGRSGKVRVNGTLASAGILAEAGPLLVEIAGQHAHARLASPGYAREALDAYAGTQDLAREVASAVRATSRARRALEELAANERERRRRLDVLRFEIDEIEGAAPRAGEAAELAAEASRREHAEQIALALNNAVDALHGEGGADELLARARTALAAAADADPAVTTLSERVDAVMIEVTDIAEEARARLVAPDPAALAEIRARLDVLARVIRKFGGDEIEVLAYLARARTELAAIEFADSDRERLTGEVEVLEARAGELASRLSAERAAAAPDMAEEARKLLTELAMPSARLEVSLEPRSLTEAGREVIELRFAADAGEALRPVGKVASGGEMSRLALVLHLLTRTGAAETLVFDEIDAGVGGTAAQQVGRALARLAREFAAQVIVVTHLPQVAAFAEHHFTIRKDAAHGRVAAALKRVDGNERLTELSRMLAGLPDSEFAREHAQELLEVAASPR